MFPPIIYENATFQISSSILEIAKGKLSYPFFMFIKKKYP